MATATAAAVIVIVAGIAVALHTNSINNFIMVVIAASPIEIAIIGSYQLILASVQLDVAVVASIVVAATDDKPTANIVIRTGTIATTELTNYNIAVGFNIEAFLAQLISC